MDKFFRKKAELAVKLFQIRILNDSLFSIYKNKKLRNSAVAPVIEKKLITKRERVNRLTQEILFETAKNILKENTVSSEQANLKNYAKGA